MKVASDIRDYLSQVEKLLRSIPAESVARVVELILTAQAEGKKIFIMGNGGSAATASHFCCDLGKGASLPGIPRLKVVSLTDNVPLLTAIGNDMDYDAVFVEQLKNLLTPGDLVICISGSGNSANVVKAAEYAKSQDAVTIALLGFGGGTLGSLADYTVTTQSRDYGPVEDVHLVLCHAIKEALVKALTETGLDLAADKVAPVWTQPAAPTRGWS